MSKKSKPFRLTPKHIVRTLLLISLLAIAALVVGIFNTINPHHEKTPQAEHSTATEEPQTEVWLPNGTTAEQSDTPEARPMPFERAQADETGGETGEGTDLPTTEAPKKHRSKAQNKPKPTENTANTDEMTEVPVLPQNTPRSEPTAKTTANKDTASKEKRIEPKETHKETAPPKEKPNKETPPKAEKTHTPPKAHKDVIDNLF